MNRKSENEVENPAEKLLHDLREVVHEGEELLRLGASELNEKGGVARERLLAALESAKDMGHRLQDGTIRGAKATDKIIRDYPYHSLGVAFGIGLLIGVLVNRK
jgi:ElaB/YqjD/DUF883 family membrane-anchored ribosome-binding protein